MTFLRTFAVAATALLAESKVTVHIVPHTHDDVGWLKTVDQYYTGANNTIQHAYVHMVIDTAIDALLANPERKFTYTEQAFFQRWWRQQGEERRQAARDLTKRGQLVFVNGGWCMHDEATAHFIDMIDQTTLGHRFLSEEFGVTPKTGWQLDPFGHSATQAALLSAEVGFTGLFFGRIDYQDLDLRRKEKRPEFIWRASPSLGPSAQVFAGLTGEYGGNYGPPGNFGWDIVDNGPVMQDDPALDDYNVPSRVADAVAFAQGQADQTRGNNIMWTMGSDFQYENAREYFYNMDLLIKHVNEDGRVEMKYSTPDEYVEAKAAESDVKWPLKTDDFFPYADKPHAFWTGFFTSRPTLKRYIRETSSLLQVFRQIMALGQGDRAKLQTLSEAMGVSQHHDAVSGTAKQHVTFDYAMRIARGRARAMEALQGPLKKLADFADAANFSACDLRNVSVCAATQAVGKGAERHVLLWNGLSQPRRELVELPVAVPGLRAMDAKSGDALPSQDVPALASVTNYGADAGGAAHTLLFEADVPAMGYQIVRVVQPATTPDVPAKETVEASGDDDVVLENDFLALRFVAGNLDSMTDKASGVTKRMHQQWLWYESSTGNDESDQVSGAYLFRPNKSEANPVLATGAPSLKVVRGDLADEVHQTFGDWVSQRVRLAKDARAAEITYTVGPIPALQGGPGKEVVSRFSTDIANDGRCSADSNGREMIERRHNWRQSWNYTPHEEVAGNYYPVTTAISIKDQSSQLTILTDAAQGGTGCVRNGELELMVHRACLKDDHRGVGEPLNETQFIGSYAAPDPDRRGKHWGPGLITRGKHFLSLAAPATAAKVWRPIQDAVYMPIWPFFADSGENFRGSESKHGFLKATPPNVQVVSYEPWDEDRLLLRLAHQFGTGEDKELSKPVTVDLADLFAPGRRIEAIDERGLTATISRQEVLDRRVSWPIQDETQLPSVSNGPADTTQVELGPLQIRTFLITFARDKPTTMMV